MGQSHIEIILGDEGRGKPISTSPSARPQVNFETKVEVNDRVASALYRAVLAARQLRSQKASSLPLSARGEMMSSLPNEGESK